MSFPVRFEAELLVEGRTATYVVVPLDVRAVFGAARPPVRARINGAEVRTTLAPYGDRWYLPVNRAFRTAAGVAAGETVVVELEPDREPRSVTVPDDLAAALAAAPAAARERFEALSFSHRREYVEWIEEAKRPETRARRIAGALERLVVGKTAR